MDLHAWILIRLIGMKLPSQAIDGRINLDCVDVLSAPLQRATDIVTGAGADYQHVRERGAAGISIQQVRQRISWSCLIAGNHLLVINQVHRKRKVPSLKINSVIRRPELQRFESVGVIFTDWRYGRQWGDK